jgi:hypothetical protein
MSVKTNRHFVKQFRLTSAPDKVETIQTDIPVELLRDGYNSVCLHIVQYPQAEISGTIKSASGGAAPETPEKQEMDPTKQLTGNKCVSVGSITGGSGTSSQIKTDAWTQIDIKNSYVELDFQLKPFEEKLSSIYKFMFDNKNLITDRVNFVFPKSPTDIDLNNYGLFANFVGTIIRFREFKIYVSTKISDQMNNVIIGNFEDVNRTLSEYVDGNSSRIAGNIGVLQNYKNRQKGILYITGEDQNRVESSLMKTLDPEIANMKIQNIAVANREKPPKMPSLSAKHLHLTGKITFKDMGINSLTLSGLNTYTLHGDLKLYPIYKFDENKDRIKVQLDFFTSNPVKLEPTFSFYMNKKFVFQCKESLPLDPTTKGGFHEHTPVYIPPSFLKGGSNRFEIETITIPREGKVCAPANIKTTVKEESYIVLPEGDIEVTLPELNYYAEMGFPFSIYPDLQKTAILITDFNAYTIASAMQIAFKLGKKVEHPGYYLTTTYDINSILDKDIVVLGTQQKKYEILYQNAPIKFTEDGITREIYDPDLNSTTVYRDITDFKDFTVAQTYQSPFYKERVILEISAKSPKTLFDGVQNGLNPQRRGEFKGDVWLYNSESRKSKSYRFKEQYILTEIDGLEKRYRRFEEYSDIDEF